MDTQSQEIQRISTIYDRMAPTWDARQRAMERRLMGGDALRRSLAHWLHGDVLEIGSGTGATIPFVEFGSDKVTSFTATDISSGMLERARTIAAGNDRIHFALMPADSLAFPDASFDTVTCSLVLCSVPDPVKALQEMSRVCKPGGRIILLEHVRAHNRLIALIQKIVTPLQARMIGCHFDRPTDQILRDLGFAVEREERRFFDIFVLLVARNTALAANRS